MAASSHRRRKVVFVVGADELERARIAGGLRATAELVRACATLAEVDAALVRESAAVIVLVPGSTPTAVLVSAIRRFRETDAATAILVCVEAGRRTGHELATLARVGLDDVVEIDAVNASDGLNRDVSRRLTHSLPFELVRQVVPPVQQRAQAYCGYCMRQCFRDLKVSEVADWFQCDPTTANRWLRKAGLRSTEHVIDYGRSLHAAFWLDTRKASVATSGEKFLVIRPQSHSPITLGDGLDEVRPRCGLVGRLSRFSVSA